MTREDANKVDYLVMIVDEYAAEKGLTPKEAFRLLWSCGGIEALDEGYDIEHTLPVSSTIDALDALRNRMERAAA